MQESCCRRPGIYQGQLPSRVIPLLSVMAPLGLCVKLAVVTERMELNASKKTVKPMQLVVNKAFLGQVAILLTIYTIV